MCLFDKTLDLLISTLTVRTLSLTANVSEVGKILIMSTVCERQRSHKGS